MDDCGAYAGTAETYPSQVAAAGPPGCDAHSQTAGTAPGRVELERIPAAADTDTLTQQTIGKMCEYIRDGITDENIQACMGAAIARLGLGRTDPYSLAWAVFWFCKHRIKKVLDEAALFRLGEPDQADMLISPAVLIRMADAAEDCDGFTSLAASMLGSSGLLAKQDQCIITVACDPRDRRRWSHVFNMIRLANGEWLPLDCHTGKGPGWMIPRGRINRWQAWNLDGQPIDVPPPVRSTLHGYVFRGAGMNGLGGLGQCDPADLACLMAESAPTTDTGSTATLSFPGMTPTTTPAAGSCPSMQQLMGITDPTDPCQAAAGAALPAGYATAVPSTAGAGAPGANLNTILSSLFGNAAKVATVANLPAGYAVSPSGAVVPAGSLSLGNMSPLFLIGGGILLLIVAASAMGKR